MVQENFEGNLSEFSIHQWKFIIDVLNERGFRDAKVTVNAVGEAGDNYVADVKRVVAEKNGKSFKIVAKVAPRKEENRSLVYSRLLFIIEHLMYNEVLPKFTELEKSAGISVDERLRYASCYGTLTDDLDELVLLEDLKESDFTMLDRLKSLTDGEMKIVLKNFAKLHSLSYAMKHQEPETYASLKNKLMGCWSMFPTSEDMKKSFEMIEVDTLSLLKDQRYKEAMKGTTSRLLDILGKNYDTDVNSRYSVFVQGDAWTNNIMFRIKKGKPVSCCMVDYQLSKVNRPVEDLLYTIFNCTDYETRKQHYNGWIDYYHSEMAKCLSGFGLKVDYIYPRDQLDADLKRHGRMSFAMATIVAINLSRESDDAKKFKAQMENIDNIDELYELRRVASLSEKAKLIFKSKIEGLIDSCLEFGLL